MNTFINIYCNHRTQRTYHKVRDYLIEHKNQQMPIIIGIFLFLSVVGALTFALIGNGYLRFGDIVFHYNRLMSMHQDIIHGQIPLFNRTIGYPQGSAVGAFYPYLTWLPFVLLTFLFKQPLTIFYLSFTIIVFVRFLISYYSYYTYDSNRFHSFVFALLYTANSSVFYWLIISEDIGASLATTFLPLTFFGYLELLKKNHWKMLTIGVVLVFYSHLVTALLTVIFLLLLFIFNLNQLTWHKFLKLMEAVIIALMVTLPQWLSLLILSSHNMITIPSGNGVKFGQGMFTQFGVIIPIIAILITLSKHWRLTYIDKQLLFVGVFCFLINANIIGDTVANVFPIITRLQFSIRFWAIGYLVFPFLIMEYMRKWSNKRSIKEHQSFIKFMILIIVALMPCFASLNTARKLRNNTPVTHHFVKNMINQIGSGKFHATFLNNKISNKELRLMRNRAYYMDYMPVVSTLQWKSFLAHHPNAFNGKRFKQAKDVNVEATNKGLEIYSKQPLKDLQIPLVIYQEPKYNILENGHTLRHSSIKQRLTNQDQLLTLKYLPKGHTQITLKSAHIF